MFPIQASSRPSAGVQVNALPPGQNLLADVLADQAAARAFTLPPPAAAALPKHESLAAMAFKEVLIRGSAEDAARAIQVQRIARNLVTPEARRELVEAVAQRTAGGVQSVAINALEALGLTSAQALRIARRAPNAALATVAIHADPSLCTSSNVASIGSLLPGVAARMVETAPHLAEELTDFEFRYFLVDNSPTLLADRSRKTAHALELMRQHPARAPYLAQCMAAECTPDMWRLALESTAPRHMPLWAQVVQRAPQVIVQLAAERPELLESDALICAAFWRKHDALEAVCRARPDLVNAVNGTGSSAAHYAAVRPAREGDALDILRRAGADLDKQNRYGETPNGLRARYGTCGWVWWQSPPAAVQHSGLLFNCNSRPMTMRHAPDIWAPTLPLSA